MATAGWIIVGALCIVSSLIMWIQGRDRYGNDGCADDRVKFQ